MGGTHAVYPEEYRRQMVELVRAGRTPSQLAREFEPSAHSIRAWVKQADVNEGRRKDGLTSDELDELRQLRRRIRQLELGSPAQTNGNIRGARSGARCTSPWQIGFAGGGRESGVGLIAIPSLLKDLDGTGTTSELAIMNLVTKPGFTDFAIFIYDQNGLLDFVCQKLHDRQVEYIDLQVWGYVANGFKGSAIISATFWEHDVFDGEGFFLRSLLGLGAVSVERTGARLGEDVPGDEAAGSRGIPFAQDDTLSACFGGTLPRCPGQPAVNPGPIGP